MSSVAPPYAPERTAVAIRHVAFEDLGSLEPALRAHGYSIRYAEAGLDSPDEIGADADLLVVLGGPIAVYEALAYPFLEREIALLRERLAGDRPTLGICLGAQLMAAALGAEVRPGGRKEIGWAPIRLDEAGRRSALASLDGVAVLHWHGDTFATPRGATLLASTPVYENQAFSYGRNALALQFHAEARARDLERWYIGHACELAAAGLDVARLRADAARHSASLEDRAAKLWSAWLSALR
ncbi:MAG TPA: glutamine amidotransferase [Usitatibacter sp.]|nr:glutamine amidotransferase [Usitatibacter sp.]